MPYKDKEKQRQCQRKWFEINRESCRIYDIEYYKKYKKTKIRKVKEYCQNNPEKRTESQRKWREKNKKIIRLYYIKWVRKK